MQRRFLSEKKGDDEDTPRRRRRVRRLSRREHRWVCRERERDFENVKTEILTPIPYDIERRCAALERFFYVCINTHRKNLVAEHEREQGRRLEPFSFERLALKQHGEKSRRGTQGGRLALHDVDDDWGERERVYLKRTKILH